MYLISLICHAAVCVTCAAVLWDVKPYGKHLAVVLLFSTSLHLYRFLS